LKKKIHSLEELDGYDKIFVCAGYGIKDLQSDLKLKYLKGQSFVFDKICKHQKGFLTKGYLVPFSDKVLIGSTYERKFSHSMPDYDAAIKIMQDNISLFFKEYNQKKPITIHSGVRVAHPNYNIPKWFIKNEKVAFLTGLGSRGLLYHAMYGKMLSMHYTDLKKMPEYMWHLWAIQDTKRGLSCRNEIQV